MPNSIDFYKRIFLHVIPVRIIVPCNSKASREGDIPINILKYANDTYFPILTKVINSSIEQNKFINQLKLADVLPIYKKDPLNRKIKGL